jgi:hypothetical protein
MARCRVRLRRHEFGEGVAREHVLRDQHRVVLYAVVFGRHVRVHDDIGHPAIVLSGAVDSALEPRGRRENLPSPDVFRKQVAYV